MFSKKFGRGVRGRSWKEPKKGRISMSMHFQSPLLSFHNPNPYFEFQYQSIRIRVTPIARIEMLYSPERGAFPASLQSHTNSTGSSVNGSSSTPRPDTLTFDASNGGPARTLKGLFGTWVEAYLTFTL